MDKGQQPSLWAWARHSALLVATIVVIFAAFSNSLTWYLQQLWGASGDFWQSLWNRFLDRFGDDEFSLFVYGTTILTMGLYWGVGSIYVMMDYFNLPKWIRKYKVQLGTNEPVDRKRLITAVGHVLFNQIFVGIPFAAFGYWMMKKPLAPFRELPNFSRVLLELAVFIVVEEIVFYYSHRFLHHRRLYKYIHKKHHEWTAPIAVTAIYCHPLEHLLSNIVPPALGTIIMSSHISTCWLWYSMAILRTLNDHSGYHLPFFPSPEAHDFHHLKFNECYGFLGILDYLHGTDTLFRSSPPFKRHIVSLAIKPLRIQFPDEPKSKKNLNDKYSE
ncbi:fatty acid hydroxylase domain-containing protein 2-like [Daphnia pulex]|uniref:fatty acid hydroxylase domain-containing protein 2-like n=1 Tax=Daphnia pulex TaxID=6669 RepID=UPI001EE10DB4|nr:fatty acid hydroxylase domain-containing protein 2-like [Daphnia pulex]XP_046457153.1 fatty acid hydroxylase domain-containing protein 2-like [Daphnia pulex]XP_046457154.1 fatty acid hydroxylase domain-containing protein 2-like [Daphnia pulex]